ncbi:hypothetical protein [Mesobacillus zeae]|uniref:Negative regulator of sigma-X activity n=1 Tax=Mesobacillus zeae TaxID=1917180 RepID=A0A398BBX3_9BACI|nr:hypothetical protein [Mesobacillus zeae]RID87332.1 hypothetical protein D1970_05245 [Mesobacillus zeae]
MRRLQRSDKQLEDLLRQLPAITDNRDPKHIFQKVSAKKKLRRPAWLFPAFATAAALFLVAVLASPFVRQENGPNENLPMELITTSDDSAESKAGRESEKSYSNNEKQAEKSVKFTGNEKPAAKYALEDAVQPEEENYFAKNGMVEATAVYPEDLKDYASVTYAIPDAEGRVAVPVTALVPKDDSKTWFTRFKETMPKLTEEKWGLKDFYPLQADIGYDPGNETVTVDMETGHPYKLTSKPEAALINIIDYSFSNVNVKNILFSTDGRPGVELGNKQQLESHEVKPSGNHAYLFLYPVNSSVPYIVPTEETFPSVEKAFKTMGLGQESNGLEASLSQVLVEGYIKNDEGVNQTLHIKLADGAVFKDEFIYSLEAILLTAKDFGFNSLKIDNPEIENVGRFNLKEEIGMPISPNKQLVES